MLDEVIDLFIELGASEEQLDFKVAYVSALNGTASLDPDISTQSESYDDIFNLIINEIPEPNANPDGNLQFQPALLDYNEYVGRIGIGKVHSGTLKVNEMVSCVRLDGSIKQFRIQKLFGFDGLKRVEINEAKAGILQQLQVLWIFLLVKLYVMLVKKRLFLYLELMNLL